uniref:Uncharacterized protein n=1 Tax=Geladintestivirus 5 TaxID=3233137 RepID=A0AAU8MJR6_9CAUD
MIDLSPIQKYIDEPDSFMTSFVSQEIRRIGLDSFLEYNFHSLDCTRVCKDGLRPTQTIGYPYRSTITEIVFAIKNYIKEDKQDEYFKRLLKRHSDNLKYEQANPPIWYGTEKDRREYEKRYGSNNSSKSKRKRIKQQDIEFPDMPKKQTIAEKKLAARLTKINALSFKIKPQN